MRPDTEQAIKEFEVKTSLNEKRIKKAEEQIPSDEKIYYISPANITVQSGKSKKNAFGIIIITEKRVFVYSKILLKVTIESFNLKDLNSIESESTGLTSDNIKLHTNTKTITFKPMHKSKIFPKVIALLDEKMNEAKNGSGSNHQNAPTSSLDDISKLAELKDKGIITLEEFEEKKRELLNKI